ncbi:hypothetical protein [Reyranella sp.]|uniref:hypothetical protein n=1 Tax=Reyranella sp. TaxID=1929291 RepID=UPI003C7AED8A
MSVIRPGFWDAWDLGDDLYAWWCGDDHGSSLMTDDGLGRISSWKDRKHRINLTAATTARPTWSATGFNSSKPAPVFDGAASCLRGTDLSLLPTGSTPCEIWALVEFTGALGTTSGRIPISYGGVSGATRRQVAFTNQTAASFTVGDGATNTANLVASAQPRSVLPKVIGALFTGTTIAGRNDGYPGLSIAAASLATTATRFAIGSNNLNTAGNFFPGVIRQVLITKILSIANRLRMEGWLAWDGGIQSVLP